MTNDMVLDSAHMVHHTFLDIVRESNWFGKFLRMVHMIESITTYNDDHKEASFHTFESSLDEHCSFYRMSIFLDKDDCNGVFGFAHTPLDK
jgi:hypothetical protein